MTAITYILVDEQKDKSKYVVCNERHGKHRMIAVGELCDPEELRAIQLQYEGSRVHIDCAFMGSRLECAANHYRWKLIKSKNGDYPFIEALVQFAS
ncbi:MAG: hypothetical protein AB9Q19_12685 [Candidatus Reddybacter sp.]